MFDKPIYDLGYASMYSDNITCDMNIVASVNNGWMFVTQNLNYSYNEDKDVWNCREKSRRGNVSFSPSLRIRLSQWSLSLEHCAMR
jgi:hypothetical protein